MKTERNSPCPCGSGKKYKKCCLISENERVQTSVLSEVEEACDDALAKIEAGDLLGADMDAWRLYRSYPDDPMVNFLKGVCCIQKKLYDAAISYFETAIQINPWFTEAYFNLAGLYRQEFKVPQSVACFKKIIEIEGDQDGLGKLAQKELDNLEKMIKTTSGQTLEEYLWGTALFDQAFECLRKQQSREAIALFQKVLELDPNHVQSYGNLALAHSALGEQKIALEYLDKALLLDPSYEPAQNNRKIIARLKEGVLNPCKMGEVFYYQEKLELEGKRKSKPQILDWDSITTL